MNYSSQHLLSSCIKFNDLLNDDNLKSLARNPALYRLGSVFVSFPFSFRNLGNVMCATVCLFLIENELLVKWYDFTGVKPH